MDFHSAAAETQFSIPVIKKNSKLRVYLEAKGDNYYQLVYPLGEVEDDVFCIYERK